MMRSERAAKAEDTLSILEAPAYHDKTGRSQDVSVAIDACLAGTRYFSEHDIAALREKLLVVRVSLRLIRAKSLQCLVRLASTSRQPSPQRITHRLRYQNIHKLPDQRHAHRRGKIHKAHVLGAAGEFIGIFL